MTPREQIAELITVGGVTGGLGLASEEADVLAAIARGEIGGVYVGYPHFRDPEHAAASIARLQAHAPRPLFVAADFETGPAYNCEGSAAHFPYFMGLGFLDDPGAVRRAAEITARQALSMGVNWLYSPCLDVNLRPDNPIVGIRAFGETPHVVARMGNAYIGACREAGILCTAKHFPGAGNTVADTHVGGARDEGDLGTWERLTLPPFVEAVRGGVPAIMTGHAAMPFLDATGAPATFSRPILRGVLRERLGFRGLVISDSLGMGGAAGGVSVPERCLRAFEAGCDVLLTPYDAGIIPAFERALESGRLTAGRLKESVARVLEAKARLVARSRPSVEPGDEAAAWAIGRRATRVLKRGKAIPLVTGSFACLTQWRNDEAQYFPREPGVLASLQHGLQLVDSGAPLTAVSRACPEPEHAAILAAAADRRVVVFSAVVKNYAGDPFRGLLSEGTVSLLRRLAADGRRIVLVLLGSPYAAGQLPEADSVLCTGGDTLGSVEGALDLLTGRRPAPR